MNNIFLAFGSNFFHDVKKHNPLVYHILRLTSDRITTKKLDTFSFLQIKYLPNVKSLNPDQF